MNLIKEAENLLASLQLKACSVSSITENGYPRIVIMIPVKTEGIKTFYFSTGTSSNKVKHYKNEPKAGVTFWNNGDSVSLIGEMSIIKDKPTKDSLWQDWLAKHFPNGGKNDPEYCIIKFEATEGTIYVKDAFDTVKI